MGVKGLYSKGPPPGPVWLLWIKIAIIVLSLIVLALAAYGISVFGKYSGGYYVGYTGASGLLIFVVIKTWLIYGALLFFELKAPQYFYRLIGLIGYSFGVIFWLSGWAWAASYASFWLSLGSYYNGFGYTYDSSAKAFGGAMAGCAALGAIVWVLSIVNLVFFVRGCLADEGIHAAPTDNAELGHVPKQAEAQVQPVYGAPQQAQPVYGQQQAYGAPQQAYGQQQTPYGAQQTPYGGAPPPQQQHTTQ